MTTPNNTSLECQEINRRVQLFAKDLTKLSQQYGLGISGSPEIFILEYEDAELQYVVDNNSRLALK